jgi:methionyl-tRNA synthetase
MIKPAMPNIVAKVQEQIPYNFAAAEWKEAGDWGKMPGNSILQKGETLFPRIDIASLEIEEESTPEEKIILKEEIEYADFAKLDLRVVKILKAEKVEKADKLLKFEVEFGSETRTVVSGIAKYYNRKNL